MRVVHESSDGETRTLAGDVEVADTFGRQFRGLMGYTEVPDDYALVFEMGESKRRGVHMVFVRTPIDVLWLDDGVVDRVETLSPWTGFARGRADTIVELAPGAADDVAAGDKVRIDRDAEN
jgi:uncharacterized membrane protein (UPF0127 family)